MNCPRCDLDLPPGAAHLNEGSCVAALRAELAGLRGCAGCGRDIKLSVCPACAAKGLAKGAASQGVAALGTALWRWLNEPSAGSEEDGEGEPRSGKRYRP
jgi:hypothetical protein